MPAFKPQNINAPLQRPPQMYAASSLSPSPASHFESSAHMPLGAQMNQMNGGAIPPRNRSRFTYFVVTLLSLLLLLITGFLYLYGSRVVAQKQYAHTALPTPEAQPIPENGFQVTESSVFEPNFDQQADLGAPTSSPAATQPVNTDIRDMFEE
jgi:hypothetical protein